MTTSTQVQEEAEISLIDILLFLKASTRNVLISTATCLLLGALYYFSVPNMYEATATIQVASVAGELVEPPAVLLEKIKLPMFFSPATIQACGFNVGLNSQRNFSELLKPTLNKSTPLISFAMQARSSTEARFCLDVVIGEIQKSQNELVRPLIDLKKEKIAILTDQLKFIENVAKSTPKDKALWNAMDAQFSNRVVSMPSNLSKGFELRDLRKQINTLESELLPPHTLPASLVAPIYAPEISVSKRPHFTFGSSLAIGVFLGLLITGVLRALPKIRVQMHAAEMQQ
jgi:Chain length determinant protein